MITLFAKEDNTFYFGMQKTFEFFQSITLKKTFLSILIIQHFPICQISPIYTQWTSTY